MSLFTEIESFLGLTATVASITTDITVVEQATIAGLTGFSALITAGATVADGVSAELETLLPSLKTAISNADAKTDGWLAALKTEIGKAQTWLAARSVTNAASVAVGAEGFHVSMIHIA